MLGEQMREHRITIFITIYPELPKSLRFHQPQRVTYTPPSQPLETPIIWNTSHNKSDADLFSNLMVEMSREAPQVDLADIQIKIVDWEYDS